MRGSDLLDRKKWFTKTQLALRAFEDIRVARIFAAHGMHSKRNFVFRLGVLKGVGCPGREGAKLKKIGFLSVSLPTRKYSIV